ncbi:MipA/OmpV family protein [Paraburkholderia sp. SIMBA_053]|uniref:MipA/OmpV family protein n=1 Tax=Paraburkholderia sp. SIMBA_053 TaxID=3085794 RepID=UPI00397A016E
MRKAIRGKQPLLLAVTSACLLSGGAWANGVSAEPPEAEDSGFTVLSNATNVTHWGLGAAVGLEPSPYSGDSTRVSPIPLISLDNKWLHAFGTTVDLKVGRWSDVTFTLRGKFDVFGGYKGSDAPILNGMENRNGAFWYGPALAWKSAFGTLSADYLLGGNKGQMADFEYRKSFELGHWSVEPHAGIDWLSSKYVNYYYGVRPSEVQPGRPEYTGKAAYNTSIGTQVNYNFTSHQMVSFDVGVSHLSSGITDSPIVGRRYIPMFKVGYLYRFK